MLSFEDLLYNSVTPSTKPQVSIPSNKRTSELYKSTNDQRHILREIVCRNLKVKWSRSLPYTAGNIVMGAMARAEPASEVAGFADGHASQVCADANHDQPLRPLNTILILLGIPQCLDLDVLGLLDLVRGSVANEDWLASPFDKNVLALRDGAKIDLDLGHSQDIRGCGHVDQEILNRSLRARRRQRAHGPYHKILKQQIAIRALLTPVMREIGDLATSIVAQALEGAVERAAGLGPDGGGGESSQRPDGA